MDAPKPRGFQSLVLLVMLLVLAGTVLVLLGIGGWFGGRSVAGLVGDVAGNTLGRVELRVEQVVEQAVRQNRLAAGLVERGLLTRDRLPEAGELLARGLEARSRLLASYVCFAATGETVYTERRPDGTVLVREYFRDPAGHMRLLESVTDRGLRGPVRDLPHDGFDPATRTFHRRAVAAGAAVWTEAYPFWRQPDEAVRWGVTHAVPVHDAAGGLVAVCGTDVGLDDLTGYLREIAGEVTGYACVAEELPDGGWRLIAHPRIGPPGTDGAEPGRPVDAARADPVLGAYLRVLDQPAVTRQVRRLGIDLARRFPTPAGAHLGSVQILDGPDLPRWALVLLMPAREVMRGTRENLYRTAVATGLFLALGSLGVGYLARRLSLPLAALARDADAIARLDLGGQPGPPSPVREVRRLQESVAGLKSSLRSFRKYVPAEVVHDLFRQGLEARLGGHEAELTILFTDIVGFTTTAESLEPQALVEHLGEYLAAVSAVVHAHGGVVDKYIGDAVLAFWGAPQPRPDHAAAAAAAALDISGRIGDLNARWRAGGRPELPTRIGLATGRVVVGNIGSEDRMNYTVIGDTVNVASRLEGLNRRFGTTILVAGATADRLGPEFVTRPAARVAVRGRTHTMVVHELVGRADRLAPSDLRRAEWTRAAFAALEAGDLPAAAAAARPLVDGFPQDPVARELASAAGITAPAPAA